MNPPTGSTLSSTSWLTLADLQSVAAARIRLLSMSALAGILFAAAYLAVAEPRYESRMIVRPVMQPTQSGGGLPLGLGALASQFGVGGGDVSAYFVASIVQSRDIAVSLLNDSLSEDLCASDSGAVRTVWRCYVDEASPDAVERASAIQELQSSISVNVDPLAGTLDVSVQARTGELAEYLVSSLVRETNHKLTTINQHQSEAEQKFLSAQLVEYRDSLTRAERALREFLEANRAVLSPELIFEERRLQSRWDFFNGSVEDLQERAQAARLSEVRDTPVLTVVDASEVPAAASWPRPMLILVGSTAASLLLGYVVALVGAARSALRAEEGSG